LVSENGSNLNDSTNSKARQFRKDNINQDSSISKGPAKSEIIDSKKNQMFNEDLQIEKDKQKAQRKKELENEDKEDKDAAIEDCVFSGADNYLAEEENNEKVAETDNNQDEEEIEKP